MGQGQAALVCLVGAIIAKLPQLTYLEWDVMPHRPRYSSAHDPRRTPVIAPFPPGVIGPNSGGHKITGKFSSTLVELDLQWFPPDYDEEARLESYLNKRWRLPKLDP
ncbi:BQ2448_1925 [Microbotryum intermedium]|uniref:BQ2448_1925 protein n=1 Tax=Microbotryum intermedium TaxID=269621 RepID=A0A238FEK2_9BASI|nr:BQ2448_1925 [Microbotryum intermedium]